MSVKIMGLIFDSALNSTEKLVMLTYADYANGEGYSIWPSVSTMSRRTSLSTRAIQIVSAKLVEKKVLERDGVGKNGTNKYRIIVENLPYEGGERDSGVNDVRKGGERDSPDSITDSNTLNTLQIKNPEEQIRESSQDEELGKVLPEKIDDLPSYIKDRQPKQTPRTSHSKEEILALTQNSLFRFGEKDHKDVDLSRFPVDVLPLVEKFVSLFGCGPKNNSERAHWIVDLRDQVNKGIVPSDIEESYNRSIKECLGIKGPGSLTTNANTTRLCRIEKERENDKLKAMCNIPLQDSISQRAARGENVDVYKPAAQIDLSEFL